MDSVIHLRSALMGLRLLASRFSLTSIHASNSVAVGYILTTSICCLSPTVKISWHSKPTQRRTAKIFALESCLSMTVASTASLRMDAPKVLAALGFDAASASPTPTLFRVDLIEAWLAAVSAKFFACRNLADARLPLRRELSLLAVSGRSSSPSRSPSGKALGPFCGLSGRSRSRMTPSWLVDLAASCSLCHNSNNIFTAPFIVTWEFHCPKSFAAFRYCMRSARQPMICRLSSKGATSNTSRSAKRPPASRKRTSFFRVPTIALQTQSTTQSV
mmetsp:Transcript_20235/g.58666  ORF Transcript_20235/g.58666 Transcript_20235/m.58666 type:complete len:274 (+) Transcript_20235:353-1174(+)